LCSFLAVACGSAESDSRPLPDAGLDAPAEDVKSEDATVPWQSGTVPASSVWARTIRCQPYVVAHSRGRLELGASGDVLIAGGLAGNCSLFGAPEVASADYDAWATRLAAADGTPVWSHRYGDDSFQNAHESDGLVLAGVGGGSVDFGGGVALQSDPTASPVAPTFVAALDENGDASFARTVGGTLSYGAVARDGSGGALVGVNAAGPVDLGQGPIDVALNQAAVARFDASGAPLYVRILSAAGFGQVRVKAVGMAAGQIAIVLGFVQGASTFEGESDGPSSSAGAPFVARLGPSGEYLGVTMFATACELEQLAVSGTHALATGRCPSVRVFALESDGSASWQRDLGAESASAAETPDGSVYLAGAFRDTLVVGDITLSSAGGLDAFIARLGADGTPVWALRFGDSSDQALDGIAVGADLFVAGSALSPPDSAHFDVDAVTRLTVSN